MKDKDSLSMFLGVLLLISSILSYMFSIYELFLLTYFVIGSVLLIHFGIKKTSNFAKIVVMSIYGITSLILGSLLVPIIEFFSLIVLIPSFALLLGAMLEWRKPSKK